MSRFIFITFFLHIFALPQTVFASCSYMPNQLYYDIATALILWPIVFLITIHLFDWAGAAIIKHNEQIIKGGAILYLWLAAYALFADIPAASIKTVIIAITLSPPLIIAAYCAHIFFRQATKEQRRYYAAGAVLFPYVGTAIYLAIQQAFVPALVSVLASIGRAILAAIFLVVTDGISRKKILVIHAVVSITLFSLAYLSRPQCCMAVKMRQNFLMSDQYCGCVCIEVPKIELGAIEKEFEKKAQDGDAAAQYEIGRFYFANSHSYEQDKIGLEWWRKAAENGNKDAQMEMSLGAYGHATAAEKKKWHDVVGQYIKPK